MPNHVFPTKGTIKHEWSPTIPCTEPRNSLYPGLVNRSSADWILWKTRLRACRCACVTNKPFTLSLYSSVMVKIFLKKKRLPRKGNRYRFLEKQFGEENSQRTISKEKRKARILRGIYPPTLLASLIELWDGLFSNIGEFFGNPIHVLVVNVGEVVVSV